MYMGSWRFSKVKTFGLVDRGDMKLWDDVAAISRRRFFKAWYFWRMRTMVRTLAENWEKLPVPFSFVSFGWSPVSLSLGSCSPIYGKQ